MPVAQSWIEVPRLFDIELLARLNAAFADAHVEARSEALPHAVRTYEESEHRLYVGRMDVEGAAKVLCDVLDLQDPDDDTPLTGACPACGQSVSNAWSCPGCELSFRSRFERDDPMIVFVRDHRGFHE